MFGRALIIIEIFAFSIAIGVYADFSHFTWWALTTFVVSNVLELIDLKKNERLEIAAATICTVVSATVPLLSLIPCTLFNNAFEEYGLFLYTFANWVVHYYPSLRLLQRVYPLKKQPFSGDAAQITTLYVAIHNPTQIYGCMESQGIYYLLPVGACVVTVLIELLLNLVKY